jgi:hypothetical protein
VVEQRVSIVHEAEEDNQRPFYPSEPSGLVGGLGPLLLFARETTMAPFYLVSNPRKTHLALKPREGLVKRSVKQETLRKGRRNFQVRSAKTTPKCIPVVNPREYFTLLWVHFFYEWRNTT